MSAVLGLIALANLLLVVGGVALFQTFGYLRQRRQLMAALEAFATQVETSLPEHRRQLLELYCDQLGLDDAKAEHAADGCLRFYRHGLLDLAAALLKPSPETLTPVPGQLFKLLMVELDRVAELLEDSGRLDGGATVSAASQSAVPNAAEQSEDGEDGVDDPDASTGAVETALETAV